MVFPCAPWSQELERLRGTLRLNPLFSQLDEEVCVPILRLYSSLRVTFYVLQNGVLYMYMYMHS